MQNLFFQPLPVHKFIEIMAENNFPLRLDVSYAADFYISNGNNAEQTMIFICLPSCFQIAEYVLKHYCPKLEMDIKSNRYGFGCLDGLNKRDLIIETLNFIYINPWEFHSAIEIGEPQRFAISTLEKFGYINPSVVDPNKIIYHTDLLDYYVSIRKAFKVTTNEINHNIYFIHYSMLPVDVRANIHAYFKYHQVYGNEPPDDIEDSFYRIDTAHKVIQFVNSTDAIQYLHKG